MSPGFNNISSTPVVTFRGVNGNLISLDETTDSSQYPSNTGIIKFVLRNERKFSPVLNFFLIIIVAIACTTTTRPAIPIGIYAIFLVLQCKYFISSVNIDTLLVVESVGIQIIGKRVFSTQESSTFLPWNTVQDVFINEVITGQRVLYYLTFLVKESIGGKETTKLVPLFYEIKPERKCLEYINNEGFEYPKELTKVIRRIIKSQPRQGQQFGTRHLLVTYNHSAWMRQDKMFAMLKFPEKTDATAFPHAFVLTVQTLNGSSTDDLRQVDQSKERTKADSDKLNNTRVHGIEEANKETTEDKKSDHQTDIHLSLNIEKKDKIDGFHKIASAEKSITGTSSISRKSEIERKKDPAKRGITRPKSLDNIEDMPQIKRRNLRGYISSEKNKNKVPPDSPAEKGIAADFADLPYQYIIEREIEGSKGEKVKICPTARECESSAGPSHKESDLPEKSLPRSPRSAQAETARSADITDLVMEGLMFTIRQDQDSITVVEQKTKLEMDEVLENSEKAETKEGEKCLLNSSLLRLENLITKIEMPETRLKSKEILQKLPGTVATERIVQKSSTHDSPGNLISSEYSLCGNNYDMKTDRVETPRKSQGHSPISAMPKFPLVTINLKNVSEVWSDRLQLDQEGKAKNMIETRNEDMEIGSELVEVKKMDETNNWKMEEEEEDEVGLELKYDEKDDLEIDKIEEKYDNQDEDVTPEVQQNKSRKDFLESEDLEVKDQSKADGSKTPIKNCTKTTISKTPRIVSNEIVTDDQIPPALQKALRQKLLKRFRLCDEDESEPQDESTSPSEDCETDEQTSEIKSTVSPSVQRVSSGDKTIDKSIKEQSSVTIDITEEFERELANEKIRKQPTRRKSLRHAEQTANQAIPEESEIRLEMWKFMQDMTRGAKVVIHRLDLANIPHCIASGSSSLSKYNISQQYATES